MPAIPEIHAFIDACADAGSSGALILEFEQGAVSSVQQRFNYKAADIASSFSQVKDVHKKILIVRKPPK